jgi:hypothetical protein
MNNRKYLIPFLLATGLAAHAQHYTDTGALIKEFDKVMAFAVQPYLHYTSTTTVRYGSPGSEANNGHILHGNFYKVNDDLYVGNEQEEMYLQDSLMIRVNHQRKTIQLNRVELASKKRMDILPLKKMDMQKMLREHYTIAAMPDDGDTGRILIRSREGGNSGHSAVMEMLLLYTRQMHLPLLMEITIILPQQNAESTTNMLAQTVSIRFGAIGMTREQTVQMPLWKDKIVYDDSSGTFRGTGSCDGYEVIKTF